MKRLLALFRRRSMERRLDEEFSHHLEMLEAQFVEQGHTAEESRRLARREFGSLELHKDAHRDERGLPWVEDFATDLKLAMRQMRHAKGFCAVAVLTMGLGIGASTTIFTLVNAALLRESPFPDPSRLKDLTKASGNRIGWPVFDSRQFVELRDRTKSFEAVAAMRDKGSLSWVRNGVASELRVMRVSSDYFRALGIEPQYGRSFSRREEEVSDSGVAVVTESLLRKELAGRMGTTLNLGGKIYAVVGALPAAFPSKEVDVYLPMHVQAVQDGDNTLVFGRLRAGVPAAQAAEESTAILQNLIEREYKSKAPGLRISLERYGSSDGRSFQGILVLLSVSVGLILLIACANLANLMLARSSSRVREMAIRTSLGAGRFRLARQLLAESVLISLLGGLAGLCIASILLPLLIAGSPVDIDSMWQVRMDGVVFAYAMGVSLVTGIIFGSVPAWVAGRVDAVEAMKDGGSKESAGRGGTKLRRSLVVAEIAVSVILLASAGVLIRGLSDLLALPSGADETRVIAAQMSLRGERYNTSERASRFFEAGIARLTSISNVEGAAVTLALPLERGLNCSVMVPSAKFRPDEFKFINWRYTSPSYLSLMRVPLLAGRHMDSRDQSKSPPIAVVSETFVKKYLEGRDAIGLTVVERCGGKTERTIIGVVADVKTNTLNQTVPPTMYIPVSQASDSIVNAAHTWFPMSWVVRTKDQGDGMMQRMEMELRATDPLQPVKQFTTIDALRAKAVQNERFLSYLVSAFALLAMLLTCAGVYGVLAFVVTQRSMEFAIKLALGAKPYRLALEVLRQGLVLSAAGLLFGGSGAVLLLRWLAKAFPTILPNTSLDPFLVGLPVLCLLAVVAVACLAPALRIARLDPNGVLRAS
jgi:predicted permease